MKKITTIIMILLSSAIIAEEIENGKESKKNSVYIRRNINLFSTAEEQVSRAIFPAYLNNGTDKAVNIQVGFSYNFEDSNFGLESRFQELKKGNLSNDLYTCIDQNCLFVPNNIGSYFRNELVVNGFYDLYKEYILVKFGGRYIDTELSNTDRYFFVDRFGQWSLGGNIGIKLVTPKLYGFFISLDLETFILRGRLNHKFANIRPRGWEDYTLSDANPPQTTYGEEITAKLNYQINERFYVGIGVNLFKSRVIPGEMKIFTTDVDRDFQKSLDFEFLGGKTFGDSFFTTILEAGYYF